MSIELRQHKDGTFTIEIQEGFSRREIDVTHVIHEILIEKLRSLKARVSADEKYLNWVVELAHNGRVALSTAVTSYQQITERLQQANEAIKMVAKAWRQKRDLKDQILQLEKLEAQNSHFLKNDQTLQNLKHLVED